MSEVKPIGVLSYQSYVCNCVCPQCNIHHVFFYGKDDHVVKLSHGKTKDASYAAKQLGMSYKEVKDSGIIACWCGLLLKPTVEVG